jgi:hypothetical protein
MSRTLPFLPVEITDEEARVGFHQMVLDLHSYFGLGDGVRVVARKLSDSDVVIKIRASTPKKGVHDFYEHIRFGYVTWILAVRLPWTKVGWRPLRWGRYHSPDADFTHSLAAPNLVGVPFHDGSV